jgi:hypothetical protein
MISDYHVEVEKVPTKPGCWDYLNVKILNKGKQIGFYQRNYSIFFDTFCPFEQNGKTYALYSKDYTGTRVMSLPDCVDICGEERNGNGFCPMEFYVPEGSKGQYGFVSGCVWGDDHSDKLQFLDLSQIEQGIFKREDRFGYVELPSSLELKECVDIVDFNEKDPIDVWVNIIEEKHYRLNDTRENIAWIKLVDELVIGDQMVKLIDYLNEKYCKKCGYYLKPRTYHKETIKEDGTKEMVECEFENDELVCKCPMSFLRL